MQKISAVWVYWDSGAISDELRYSMRSVAANFLDLENIVLCGDRPEWYAGDIIRSPRVSGDSLKKKHGTRRWQKWVDSIVKLQRIVESPLVTDQFLWLYDDTFFVKPIDTQELLVPRATRLLCADPSAPTNKSWREVLRRTTLALYKAGLPARNFSHHGPIIYDKDKLRQTFAKFDPLNNPRAIESLYMNHHTELNKIRALGQWLQYAQKPGPGWAINPVSSVVNVGQFNQYVQSVINPMFSQQATHELVRVEL